jgi:histidinol phosphatase-like PHP family hydrolase
MLVDLHVHIKKKSRCAKHDHIEMAVKARDVGLDGVVLLDHHYYLEDKELQEAQEASGIKIFRGIELTVKVREDATCGIFGGANDVVLISPVNPTFDCGDYHKPISNSKMPDLIRFAQDNDALTILAHPFRKDHPVVIDPFGLDCVEIASKNTSPENRSDIVDLAEHYGLKCVATSDAHRTRQLGNYCIDLDYDVENEVELSRAVKNGRFTLLERRLAPVLNCSRN